MATYHLCVCFTIVLFGLETASALTPAPLTCQDASAIDCSLEGMCSDTEFASLLCPVTCGRCSNLVADCSSPEGAYCLTHPDVCTDIELAVTMCPFMCGFCGNGVATFGPTSPQTTVDSPSLTTDSAPPECPTCVGVSHTMDCLNNIQACSGNQVCKGTVDDWKLTMRCTSPLICTFEELQSTRNCTSEEAFAPHEHCTLCCQGDECARDLALVQEGLNKIPSVLHCPACEDETDPRVCAERIVPCADGDNVCQIVNDNGAFTASCGKKETCADSSVGGNNCRLNVGVCSYCCQTSECLSRALAVASPLPEPSPGSQPECQDADYYPCQFAQSVACNDEDMSLTVCPVTCGRCGDL